MICEMWNVHMFIMFVRIEIRKTRNTDDSLGTRTKLLLPSLSLGFRHEERESQFFYADSSSIVSSQLTDQTNARTPRSPQTGLALPKFEKSTRFVQVQISTNCFFPKSLKIPAHRFRAWRHYIPSPICSLGFLLWHLWLSHPPRTRMAPCVNVCTYPCT